MSHIAEYQCALAGVDANLLKLALEATARQLVGGVVSDTVDSYYGSTNLKTWNGKKIFASIRSKALPQGVGLHIDKKGKIQFLVNTAYVAETSRDYFLSSKSNECKQCEDEFKKIESLVEMNYKVLAMTKVLAEMGYEIDEAAGTPDNSEYYMRATQAVEQ